MKTLLLYAALLSVGAHFTEAHAADNDKSCSEKKCYDDRKKEIDKKGNSHDADKKYDKCKDQCDREKDKRGK